MRAVVQRVTRASVQIGGIEHAAIGRGLLILLGVAPEDGDEDVAWLAGKLARLRVFADDRGLMNLALPDIAGEALVVSQFTLFASTAKGNRPAFTNAAVPTVAEPLYRQFVAALATALGRQVATGVFAADMQVALINDGPVTIVVDSRRRE